VTVKRVHLSLAAGVMAVNIIMSCQAVGSTIKASLDLCHAGARYTAAHFVTYFFPIPANRKALLGAKA